MNRGKRLVFQSVVGLMLGSLGLVGCEGEDSPPAPGTGSAGIPKNKGPVSSKMPKAGGAAKTGPTRPAAPAPTDKP